MGMHLATIITTNGKTDIHYYHNDHLGTSSIVTNSNNDILDISDTLPYGETRYHDNDEGVTDYFALHEKDTDTGLTYMKARYYDPVSHRFMSLDPVAQYNPEVTLNDPQQLNAYAYARNNPMTYVDPDGEFAVLAGIAMAGAITYSFFDDATYVGEGPLSGQSTSVVDGYVVNNLGGDYDALSPSQQIVAGVGVGILSLNPKKALVDPLQEVSGAGVSIAQRNLVDVLTKVNNRKISNSIIDHAFERHSNEFARIGLEGRDAVHRHINNVLDNPTSVYNSTGGKQYFHDVVTDTVVISNPNSLGNKGTAFIPTSNGIDYIKRKLREDLD